MKVIILGAGELGKNLATILTQDHHDVVLIDRDAALLQRLEDHLDVMYIVGAAASVSVLKQANIGTADLLVAATGDEATNILACKVASHYNVSKRLCRLYSTDFFKNTDGLKPEHFGITDLLCPEDECVEKIANALISPIVLEKIKLSLPTAVLVALSISSDSPLVTKKIKELSYPELLNVRFAALIRNRALLEPDGETIFMPGDEIYLAGEESYIEDAISLFSSQKSKIHQVIIGGATRISKKLTFALQKKGYAVRVIAEKLQNGELLMDDASMHTLVLHGNPTENHILLEAGTDNCDAYVSALQDDEDNILSSILAKKTGAKKVVAITNKAEYIDLIPEMNMIDCGFNSGLVAVNTVLRKISLGKSMQGIEAVLHRYNAYVYEFIVAKEAPVANHLIKNIKNPERAIFAMIIRSGEVINASGDQEIIPGDIVAIITTPKQAEKIACMFSKKKRGLF